MNFSTKVAIQKAKKPITLDDAIFITGSCFAESIGNLLAHYKFNTLVNPFGIIYNPLSIANSLNLILNKKNFIEKDLLFFNEKWLSLQHHGRFSNSDKNSCLNSINNAILTANKQLQEANYLVITFGSAWVYEHIEHGLVANCHKIPGKYFTKRLLEVHEIVTTFHSCIKAIKEVNPAIELVFTVSPVRHIKDGLWENNLSKAVLHLAVKKIIESFEHCIYFPAYELVVDELRDYRFFENDMVHPSELAVKYVWQKFSSTYLDDETQNILYKIDKIQQAAAHRPFDFYSEKHQAFIQKQLDIIQELVTQFPQLNFAEEKEMLIKN